MPEQKTINRARQKAREGKRATTQAGEFVREEIRHLRRGKHGARSAKQAIAIGLSKARRAGVPLPPPKKRKRKEEVEVKPNYSGAGVRHEANRPETKDFSPTVGGNLGCASP